MELTLTVSLHSMQVNWCEPSVLFWLSSNYGIYILSLSRSWILKVLYVYSYYTAMHNHAMLLHWGVAWKLNSILNSSKSLTLLKLNTMDKGGRSSPSQERTREKLTKLPLILYLCTSAWLHSVHMTNDLLLHKDSKKFERENFNRPFQITITKNPKILSSVLFATQCST